MNCVRTFYKFVFFCYNDYGDNMKDIIEAFNYVYNKEILNVEKTLGSQNDVFIITTNTKKYILKKYCFTDLQSLKEREEQLRISKIWNDNGIPCVQPLTSIYSLNGNYFIIYPYIEGINYNEGELNKEQVEKIAKIQARMHKLHIRTWLPCHNKVIKYKKAIIQDVIDKCNSSIEFGKNELCVCHNDFKPLNIIWVDDNPYIVDFDAVYKNNPTFSLIESAYTNCHKGNEIDMDLFEIYINSYKKEYKHKIKNVTDAIYGSWNGKLQWLDYLTNNRADDLGIEDLTNQMVNYQKYVSDIKRFLDE